MSLPLWSLQYLREVLLAFCYSSDFNKQRVTEIVFVLKLQTSQEISMLENSTVEINDNDNDNVLFSSYVTLHLILNS